MIQVKPEEHMSKEQIMQLHLLGFTLYASESGDSLVYYMYSAAPYKLRITLRYKYMIKEDKKIRSIVLKDGSLSSFMQTEIFTIRSFDHLGPVMEACNVQI